jgi:WD40 repeat protein
LKLSNKFIVFNKKSKIFTVKLSKTSTKVKKFLKIPIFHQSKTIKSLNFLYFPTSSYFLTYNLSTHKIKSQKLPEVPSCLKISIANQLLLLSFQGKIQGYNISPFKPFLIHTTKDKINSLAINSIGTTFAASYLDSKDNLSYILLINLSRDIKKCIETKISDPLLCLEFSKSLENLASISSKGKVSIWTSDTCKNVKSIDLNYPFPLKLSFSLKEKFLYLSFRNESIMSLDIKTQEKTKITSFDLFQLKNDLDENDFEGFTYLV